MALQALFKLVSPIVRQLADRMLYMFYIYVLYNQEVDKIYIGVTNNLEKRLEEHNEKKGNHFTAKYSGLWKTIYYEMVNTKREALIREKQLKSYRGREYIKKFIPR